jgi:hypothetical protein
VRIRRHLSYANVVATLALIFSLAGGAYAITKVDSRDIVNGSIKSIDLKNRKAVSSADVKRNDLTGAQINEGTLSLRGLLRAAGNESLDCDPSSSTTYTECSTATIHLRRSSRLLVLASGNEESISGPAQASCRVQVDSTLEPLAVEPGEESSDNTSGTATNGFARTLLTRKSFGSGAHSVALVCKQLTGDVRIDVPTIAAIAVGSG